MIDLNTTKITIYNRKVKKIMSLLSSVILSRFSNKIELLALSYNGSINCHKFDSARSHLRTDRCILETSSGLKLICTQDHHIYIPSLFIRFTKKPVLDLNVGESVCVLGTNRVIKTEKVKSISAYYIDIKDKNAKMGDFVINKDHCYFANNILVGDE